MGIQHGCSLSSVDIEEIVRRHGAASDGLYRAGRRRAFHHPGARRWTVGTARIRLARLPCARRGRHWVVLDGGFARLSQKGDLRTSLMGLGDISADLCIVDTVAPREAGAASHDPQLTLRREQGLLPSQAADNLYWIGRYGERGHQTARFVRTLLDQFSLSAIRLEARGAATRRGYLLRHWVRRRPRARAGSPRGLRRLRFPTRGGRARSARWRATAARSPCCCATG